MEFVPFPLFHGTSSHFLSAFKPGMKPPTWPHKDSALNLLRDTWAELRALGQKPWFYTEDILSQVSGASNWQHGDELYLTASKRRAAKHACGSGLYGGELLKECRDAIEILTPLDQQKVEHLLQTYNSIAGFLQNPSSPLVVQFDVVRTSALSTERIQDDVLGSILAVENAENDHIRDVCEQSANFRLANGHAIVSRVFNVKYVDDDRGRHFVFKEIHASELWD